MAKRNQRLPRFPGTSEYGCLVSRSPRKLLKIVEKYFAECEEFHEFPTLTGLALVLGLSRKTLSTYEKCGVADGHERKDEIDAVILYARQLVEAALERRLAGSSVAGVTFNLERNFGWQGETRVSLTNPNGDPLELKATLDPTKLSTDTIKEILAARESSTDTKRS